MDNPFYYDWEREKMGLLKGDYRIIALCLGVTLVLFPLAYYVTPRLSDEIAELGIFLYVASLGTLVLAGCLYKGTQDFKRDWYRPAASKGYLELQKLCAEYPIAGAQCRAEVARLLSLNGFLTTRQVDWFRQDLRTFGDRERVEALKKVFMQPSE